MRSVPPPARSPVPRPAPILGPVIRVRRIAGAPVVAIRAWIPGGSRVEPSPGLSLVTGRLLAEGTRRRSWKALADEVEALGMDLSASGNLEGHGLSLDALATDWERAVEWTAELLLEATFPEDRCHWLRRRVGAELESLRDRPEVRTSWAFLEHLYCPHPLARPVQGTAEGLAALEAPECATFHRWGLRRGVVIGVAGDVDETAVETRLRGLFADLESGSVEPAEPPEPQGWPETRRVVELERTAGVEPGEGGQAHLFAGHPTIPRFHPDYEALELAGVVLGAGAGLTGRIPERIREREGLAYSSRGDTVAGCALDPGRLQVYAGVSIASVERAEEAVREEIARLVEEGISGVEMEEARSYLLGREPFERETARQWAELLAESVLYGIPLDRPGWREGQLARLSSDRVEEAVRRHLRPAEVKVTVGIPA